MNIRELISFIRCIEEDNGFEKAVKDKILKSYRKESRRMLNVNINTLWESTHYRDDYECWYTKEFFKNPFSDEEKEKFINDQWRTTGYAFDCSGRPFTTSIVICNLKKPNSFGAMAVVYHFMAHDY